MTIKAFEITSDWSESPVTIFAHEIDQAARIFADWAEAHHHGQRLAASTIYPFGERRLETRSLLHEAASQNMAGVGYWIEDKQSWIIAHPQNPAIGDLVRPERQVNFYRVESDPGDDASVFAVSLEHALSLYSAWHVDCWGCQPEHVTVHKMSRWDLMGMLATLRDDMHEGITGVARENTEGEWRIFPPDWEPEYHR